MAAIILVEIMRIQYSMQYMYDLTVYQYHSTIQSLLCTVLYITVSYYILHCTVVPGTTALVA